MPQNAVINTNDLMLDALIDNLASHAKIDAVAMFGSRPSATTNPVSDYDLLIMVDDPPVRIFQLQTFVSSILTDVAFVETQVAERVMALEEPVRAFSDEGFLIGWLQNAHILYDRSGRFAAIQSKLAERDWRSGATASDIYNDWFWLNLDLRHMKRMAQSDDPIYQITVDLHLMTNLSQLWRVYYNTRGLHWQGVKAAARYLSAHDPAYLHHYQACLSEPDRLRRLSMFEHLATLTLPDGVWVDGSTALFLKDGSEHPERVGEALAFWEMLTTGASDH